MSGAQTDTGAESRLQILDRTAAGKILAPLSAHGWNAKVVGRHPEDSGYLIIEASRAGTTRRVALLYTTGVKNTLYKSLQDQVEVFFINGQLYKVESYAYGVTKPVRPVDEFFETLVRWNREVSPGKLAVDYQDAVGERVRREFDTIRSENPVQQIWAHLRQLGSVGLAAKLIRDRGVTDETRTASKATGLAYSIRNATDYFRARSDENISQRILSRYYGTLAFAAAELLAASEGIDTLEEIEDSTRFGHGLYTIDANDAAFSSLTVGPLARGFFPKWAKALGKNVAAYPAKKPTSDADLSGLAAGMFAPIRDLFARVPDVGDLFLDVFDAPHLWVMPLHDSDAHTSPGEEKAAGATYAYLVDRSCRLEGADIAKLLIPISQIQFVKSEREGRYFRALVDRQGHDSWWSAIRPIHQSPFLGMTGALILPLFGDISEFRVIALVVLYALSIIVRYRPSLWRRIQEADWDHYKVLIEATLDVFDRVLPQEFLQSITGTRINAAQPGSWLA